MYYRTMLVGPYSYQLVSDPNIVLLLIVKCTHTELAYCSHETTDEGTRGTFQWTKTAVNDIATAACYYGPTDEMATRLCVSLDTWAVPSVAACRTVVSEQFDMIVMVSADRLTLHMMICWHTAGEYIQSECGLSD